MTPETELDIGARSVSERHAASAACNRISPSATARLRFALQTIAVAFLFVACSSNRPVTQTGDRTEDGEIKKHADQWHPNEAQSDFLDIGKQAGIEWLSFVQQDQREYPEYFEGLDRDQKRRLRLAPKESDERVLLQFDLPEGSKLWPVDWYGTELMAIETPNSQGISVALCRPAMLSAQVLAGYRAKAIGGISIDSGTGRFEVKVAGTVKAMYREALLEGRTGSWLMIAEWWSKSDAHGNSTDADHDVLSVLNGISIKRELALEGSPKHKCSSTLEEQLGGTLRYPDGVLKLPISDGHLVRKIGGDSTIQIDGLGAEPWILIRRMKQPEGDMRAALRRETTFSRRTKVPSAKFGKGYTPQDAQLPMVAWAYGDSGAENELVGVIKAGRELLVFEVVSTGLRDGEKRREAKAAAIKLLAGATADDTAEAAGFERLIGWNAGE